MTANQSTALVKNPNTKKAVAVLTKFAKLETQYKAAEKEAKAATELIKNAMIEAGVPKIDIDLPTVTGYITLAERVGYKDDGATEDVLDEVLHFLATHKSIDTVELENKLKYLKLTLDTDKVKAQATLTGSLPDGVAEARTQYITKKFKAKE
jgi:hypothetical protein